MISAFGVEDGVLSKGDPNDQRKHGAALVGAGAATAAVGEYASANYNMRHGGHSGLKNLGTEDIGTHRAYVKTPNDPNWHDHHLNLGRAEGAVHEEKRVLRHLTRGVAGSNAARLAGYGAAATGAVMVARGNKRRKVKKSDSDDLSPAALQGAGTAAAVGGLGLRQLYNRKAKIEGARAATADKLHAKTADMHKMTPAAKERRYGFHEGRARQARHFETVFRGSARTGGAIAAAGGATLGLAAYGKHMQNVGQRHQLGKSAFGVEHTVSKSEFSPGMFKPVTRLAPHERQGVRAMAAERRNGIQPSIGRRERRRRPVPLGVTTKSGMR